MLIKNDIAQELQRVQDAIAAFRAKGTDAKDGHFYLGGLLGAEQEQYRALEAQQRVLQPLAQKVEAEESIQGFITRKRAALQLMDGEIEEFEMELAKMNAKRAHLARFVEQLEQEVAS